MSLLETEGAFFAAWVGSMCTHMRQHQYHMIYLVDLDNDSTGCDALHTWAKEKRVFLVGIGGRESYTRRRPARFGSVVAWCFYVLEEERLHSELDDKLIVFLSLALLAQGFSVVVRSNDYNRFHEDRGNFLKYNDTLGNLSYSLEGTFDEATMVRRVRFSTGANALGVALRILGLDDAAVSKLKLRAVSSNHYIFYPLPEGGNLKRVEKGNGKFTQMPRHQQDAIIRARFKISLASRRLNVQNIVQQAEPNRLVAASSAGDTERTTEEVLKRLLSSRDSSDMVLLLNPAKIGVNLDACPVMGRVEDKEYPLEAIARALTVNIPNKYTEADIVINCASINLTLSKALPRQLRLKVWELKDEAGQILASRQPLAGVTVAPAMTQVLLTRRLPIHVTLLGTDPLLAKPLLLSLKLTTLPGRDKREDMKIENLQRRPDEEIVRWMHVLRHPQGAGSSRSSSRSSSVISSASSNRSASS